jgi:hypothetical protein
VTNREAATATVVSRAYRRYELAALIVAYAFNLIDRQILAILAVPIKSEFSLRDTRLSLMAGSAFALFYTFLAIPIARIVAAARGS